MPIDSSVTIKPSMGGGALPLIDEGMYDVEISDISEIPAEQNPYGTGTQYKMYFRIVEGPFKDTVLSIYLKPVLNPGWENGQPSKLYLITKAVMGEDPDMEAEFVLATLMGGKLQVLVEQKTTKAGAKFSTPTRFIAKKNGESASQGTLVDSKTEAKSKVPVDEIDPSDIPF